MSAQQLERLAAYRNLASVNERDHLQPSVAAAARALAEHWQPRFEVATQLPAGLAGWPRLGGFDIALALSESETLALELKCGVGVDALGPCVWDAAKCASAVQSGTVSGAFLLAAAPIESWSARIRGTEFFDGAPHDMDRLRVAYADWWRMWRREDAAWPSELPSTFTTVQVSTSGLDVGGQLWVLRLARVLVDDANRIPWPHESL